MKKIIYLFILLLPNIAFALTAPNLNSSKAILYDLTDQKILYQLNPTEKSDIASLTKIMTTITAIENIDNLDEKIKITNEMLNFVRWDASVAGLKVGDIVSYRDLLYASMLPSGADATISIAISTSNDIASYVAKMNELAKKIGLLNTHFTNVTGLDEENHYSTVNDILTLLKYALNNPIFKEIYTTKEYTLSNGLKVKSTINNYNKYLNLDTSRILGSKTGFTLQAGLCFSAIFTSNNHEFITITLGAKRINGKPYNIIDTLELINYVDKNYQNQILLTKDTLIKSMKVENSKISSYNIKAANDITLFLPNDYDQTKFTIEYQGLEKLSYKNKIGEEIGTVTYIFNNQEIYTEKIFLKQNIEKNIIKIINNNHLYLLLFIHLLITIPIIIRKVKS